MFCKHRKPAVYKKIFVSVPIVQVNLSCNFFKGTFDIPRYIDFVHQYWTLLSALEAKHGLFGYNASAKGENKSKDE